MSAAASGPVLVLHLLLLGSPVSPARYYGQVAENSPAGTPVDGVLLPVGAGGCPGAVLTARLTGDYASDFRLIQHRGDRNHRGHLGLVSAKALDREFIAMYELTVALPPRCLRRPAAVQVEVSDRNDNAPRFTGGNQTVEADELAPLGRELARFRAQDGDAERNGRVTFYASPESHLLHVVPRTGQVMLVGSLLGLGPVTLRLYVRDGGDAPLVGEPVFLRVHVRRFSGAQPRRRRPRALTEERVYTVTVPDPVRVGDLVFTVPDHKFEQRWFEVISEGDSLVQIERDSGRLYLARDLLEPAEVLVKVHNPRGWTRENRYAGEPGGTSVGDLHSSQQPVNLHRDAPPPPPPPPLPRALNPPRRRSQVKVAVPNLKEMTSSLVFSPELLPPPPPPPQYNETKE